MDRDKNKVSPGSGKRSKHRPLLRIMALVVLTLVSGGAIWAAIQRQQPNDALLRALQVGDMATAERALQHGADANLTVAQCWPSQQLSDRLSFFQYKLMRPREYYDIPLLFAATTRNDAASVRLLLAHGADVNAKMPDGLTALKIAKNSGATKIMDMLEKAGARP